MKFIRLIVVLSIILITMKVNVFGDYHKDQNDANELIFHKKCNEAYSLIKKMEHQKDYAINLDSTYRLYMKYYNTFSKCGRNDKMYMKYLLKLNKEFPNEGNDSLGEIYRWGRYSVKKDINKALEYYLKEYELMGYSMRKSGLLSKNIAELYIEKKLYKKAFKYLYMSDNKYSKQLLTDLCKNSPSSCQDKPKDLYKILHKDTIKNYFYKNLPIVCGVDVLRNPTLVMYKTHKIGISENREAFYVRDNSKGFFGYPAASMYDCMTPENFNIMINDYKNY